MKAGIYNQYYFESLQIQKLSFNYFAACAHSGCMYTTPCHLPMRVYSHYNKLFLLMNFYWQAYKLAIQVAPPDHNWPP